MAEGSGLARVEPIAGTAIIHEASFPLDFRVRAGAVWSGTPALAEPVTVRHVLGATEDASLGAVLDAKPWCTYCVDGQGALAIRFHRAGNAPEQLLRVVRPGFEYELTYATPPDSPVMQWQRDLTIFTAALSQRGRGLIAHACGFALEGGSGVLCPGVSGAGKSTLARLLTATGRASMLSDDRVAVAFDRDSVSLWGTPWPGDAEIMGTGRGTLFAVVFPRHGSATTLRPVSGPDAAKRLMNTLALPLWDGELLAQALGWIDRLVSEALLFEYEYPPTVDAAESLIDQLSSRSAAT